MSRLQNTRTRLASFLVREAFTRNGSIVKWWLFLYHLKGREPRMQEGKILIKFPQLFGNRARARVQILGAQLHAVARTQGLLLRAEHGPHLPLLPRHLFSEQPASTRLPVQFVAAPKETKPSLLDASYSLPSRFQSEISLSSNLSSKSP